MTWSRFDASTPYRYVGYPGAEHWDPWARAGLQSTPRFDEWLSPADVVNGLACWDGAWREGFNARWGVHEGEPVEPSRTGSSATSCPPATKLAAADPDKPDTWPDRDWANEDHGEFRWLKDMMFSVLKPGTDFCTSPWPDVAQRFRVLGYPDAEQAAALVDRSLDQLDEWRGEALELGDEAPAVANRIFTSTSSSEESEMADPDRKDLTPWRRPGWRDDSTDAPPEEQSMTEAQEEPEAQEERFDDVRLEVQKRLAENAERERQRTKRLDEEAEEVAERCRQHAKRLDEERAKQERRRRLERPSWQDIEAKAEKDIATATRWAQGRRTIELLESTRRVAWVTAVAVTVWPLLAWLFLRAKLAAFFDPFSAFFDP